VLRLDRAGRGVLRRVCAAGTGGRDVLDFRRTALARVWLVAHGIVRRRLARRPAGGVGGTADRAFARPARRPAGAVHRGADQRRGAVAVVPYAVDFGVLPAVLHRAHELGGAIRARPLRRAQQLVRAAAHDREFDRHLGADDGPRRDAACCPNRDSRPWLARWMAGLRRVDARRRVRPDLVAGRAAAGGSRPPSRWRHATGHLGDAQRRAGAALFPAAGASYALLLAAPRVHDAGLPGAGRG